MNLILLNKNINYKNNLLLEKAGKHNFSFLMLSAVDYFSAFVGEFTPVQA